MELKVKVIYSNGRKERTLVMKNERSCAEEFRPARWASAGFDRSWQTKKTDLEQTVHKGVQDSVKALEDSKKTNQAIIGYRPD